MQKVVGSSPIIRFEKPRISGVFVCSDGDASPECVPVFDAA